MALDEGTLPAGVRGARCDRVGRSFPCNDHDGLRHDPGANETLLVNLLPDASGAGPSCAPMLREPALGRLNYSSADKLQYLCLPCAP